MSYKRLVTKRSTRPFRFGDGKVVHSTRKGIIPAKIGRTKCKIETEVVPADIPMLLSKTLLKRASAVLDIAHDKATMFEQPVQTNNLEKKTVLVKLHRQFGHASVERLHKLLACAGNNDEESNTILKDIVKNCETCIRNSKPKRKPVVGLPMASTYNETIALDLHECHGLG